jgi:hypothetical protein
MRFGKHVSNNSTWQDVCLRSSALSHLQRYKAVEQFVIPDFLVLGIHLPAAGSSVAACLHVDVATACARCVTDNDLANQVTLRGGCNITPAPFQLLHDVTLACGVCIGICHSEFTFLDKAHCGEMKSKQ